MSNNLPQDKSVNKSINEAFNSLNEEVDVRNTETDKKLKNRRRMKKAIWFIVIVFLVYKLFNCGANHYDVTWDEEVQLDDKNIIWVKRSIKGTSYLGLGASGSSENGLNTISSILPLRGSSFPVLSTKYDPFVIDYEENNNIWTVVAYTQCMDLDKQGYHLPPYEAYQSINGKMWVKTPVPKRLVGKKKNLLFNVYLGDKQPKFVFIPYVLVKDNPVTVMSDYNSSIISQKSEKMKNDLPKCIHKPEK